MAKTADQMAKNWIAAMQSPTTSQKYKQGIANTQVNPMAKAADPAALQLYLNKVQLSVSSGRRAARLLATPVERWRNNAMNIGATQLSTGAAKATDKVNQHFQKWAPTYQQMHDTVQNMAKGGLANAMARVQAAISVAMQAAGTM